MAPDLDDSEGDTLAFRRERHPTTVVSRTGGPRPAGEVDVVDPVAPEQIAPGPVRSVARPVMLQRWDDITWLHWPYDPDVIQATLPRGVRVDTFDGRAWVGLVPFRMTRLRPPRLPAVPWLSTFPEINVRTYVVAPDGRRAVWFWSLDVPRSPAVAVARSLFGLPYYWAGAHIDRTGGRLRYTAARRWPAPRATTSITVAAGDRVAPEDVSDLEHFLTARFGLLTVRWGRLLHGSVDHPVWPLRRADLVALDDGLVAAAGLPRPDGPPLVHYADGVPVRVGPLERLHVSAGG